MNLCFIDEQLSLPGDEHWEKTVALNFIDNLLYSHNSIIYCISDKTNQDKILELVKSTFWFSFFCALVKDSNRIFSVYRGGEELSDNALSNISLNLVGMVTDAYDLEGLLICSKKTVLSELENPFI